MTRHSICLLHRYVVKWSADRGCFDITLDGVSVGSDPDRAHAISIAAASAAADADTGIPAAVFLMDENGNERKQWP